MFDSSSFSHGGHRPFNFPSSGQNFQWGGDLTPSPLSGATPLPDDLFESGTSHGQCIPQPVFHQGAYIHDRQQITVLQGRCKMLELEVVKLTTERDSIKEMFERLASSTGRLQQADPLQLNAPLIPISPTDSQRPSRATHPNVRFWDQIDFQKWCDTPAGQGHSSSPVNLVYLEDENGRTVSSRTIKSIRRVLRGGWSELVTRKIAPHSWGKLSASGRQLIHTFMEHEFPLFKLANNGWKLDHLATTTYPAWRRNNLDANGDWKSGGNIKKEDDNDDIDNECAESDGEGTNARKRKQVAESVKCEGGKKKRKTAPALGSPSPALGSPSPALVSPSPALVSPSPALASPSPALASPSPALASTSALVSTSALASSSPALASSSPALASSSPALASSLSPLASLPPALASTVPLIQPIVSVDAPAPPNAVSNAVKENIPLENQPIIAPKPVRLTIVNPLSTLALCAANMQFPTPAPTVPALECEVQKATVNSNPAEPMPKPKKAKGKMRPTQTRNGRNLCAHRWLKQIKTNGTTDEFGVYYMSLAENQRTAYDKEVTDLVAANKWDKTIGQGRMY
ncbi:hypothetical protein DEU56DRAFT_958276 [Suillus clintonianus]|uniref:uncharacterized protein n=1 Tax=Suillus clintonianus TaxID=1904413 RepID=UPI001B867002|nr:uncharacterized protein DEU56DRAFT_958276 [Suillus clintonianus]KAG2152969.1 hypothetical protein DEU56DRAFT_958276 [Suillus clintonianus]